LAKPAYLLRPQQVVLRARNRRAQADPVVVRLPWGASLAVDRRELIGAGIARSGVHELPVTEAMWRLADRTDVAFDVGANVGYYTSLLAARTARVVAFEPHPVVAEQLARNVARWPSRDRVVVDRRAASDASGGGTLVEPESFTHNNGTAMLLTGAGPAAGRAVATVVLDEVAGEDRIGILKLDVEGHELAALRGMDRALGERRVRDIFFEDHDALPTPASTLLVSHGYTLFAFHESLLGVRLAGTDAPPPRWDAPTYLATADPDRAVSRVNPRGWHSLRPGRR